MYLLWARRETKIIHLIAGLRYICKHHYYIEIIGIYNYLYDLLMHITTTGCFSIAAICTGTCANSQI